MAQHLKFGILSKVNSLDLLHSKTSLKAFRALLALHFFADEHGRVFSPQRQIATQIGIQQSELSRGLKELCRKGYVFHHQEPSRSFYRIDPALIRYTSGDVDLIL